MSIRGRSSVTRTTSPLTCLSMTEVLLPIWDVPIRVNSASLEVGFPFARELPRLGEGLAELLESTGSNREKSGLLWPYKAPDTSNSAAVAAHNALEAIPESATDGAQIQSEGGTFDLIIQVGLDARKNSLPSFLKVFSK